MERVTHAHDGAMAVFLIGMTLRKPWRVDVWGPAFAAMPRMLRELEANRAAAERGEAAWLGFLGAWTTTGARGPVVIQYWRSVEDVYAYAGEPDSLHRPAWAAFNRRARSASGAVGVWHETYAVAAGGAESVYVGLGRPVGLGRFSGVVEVGRRGESARERLASTLTPERED